VSRLSETFVWTMLMPALLSGCGRDRQVPTSEDNQAMDAASNRLDNAADELDRVHERLPDENADETANP